MGDFKEKDMYIYDSKIAIETFEDFIAKIPEDFDGCIFYKIRRDAIGKSGR